MNKLFKHFRLEKTNMHLFHGEQIVEFTYYDGLLSGPDDYPRNLVGVMPLAFWELLTDA